MATVLLGFLAGLAVAVITAPVGVSGAVFLLPVQFDLLKVPSPSVTPTNLLFNVVATPGPLLRYHQQGQLTGPLVRLLAAGTLPGVILGAIVRVQFAPGARLFHLLLAALLPPLGGWLCTTTLRPRRRATPTPPRPARSARSRCSSDSSAGSTASAGAPSSARSTSDAAYP